MQAAPDEQKVVTLLDVAREAGVSPATASRVLNGNKRRVREPLRLSVVEAARRLGYAPNAQAQAVARGKTSIVGLIVHDIDDPYFSAIASGVLQAADENELLVTVACTLWRPELELEHLATLRGQRSRAVILTGSRPDDSELTASLTAEIEAYHRSGGRLAMVSQPQPNVDAVVLPNREGSRELANTLVGLGYKKFAILAGPKNLLTARERLEGFAEVVRSASLPKPLVVHGDFTRSGGYAAMAEIIESGHDFDCVFAVNDVMAIGALTASRDRGRSVPEAFGIAGFDDISTLQDISPTITTVRLPLASIGAWALEMVLDAPLRNARRKHVGFEIVVRESTPDRQT